MVWKCESNFEFFHYLDIIPRGIMYKDLCPMKIILCDAVMQRIGLKSHEFTVYIFRYLQFTTY